jgi:chemotaxis protein CheX
MPEPSFNELARLYGLDPVPESVARSTQLVARQDADLGEIAKVISQDPAITQRLLRAANPRAKHEDDYAVCTVENAVMRNGVGCVLLLAMGSPLGIALVKTFKTMLDQKLESLNPKGITPFLTEHVLGTIAFSGNAEGRVYLRLSDDGARAIAARILGVAPNEITLQSDLDDAVGELLNIVTGNFKSNLCDAGLNCRLHTPSVTRTGDVDVKITPGAGVERMVFRAPDLILFVDIAVNPWNQD